MDTIKAPGRTVTVGETVRKLNPHVFGQVPADKPATLSDPRPAGVPAKKRIRQDEKPLLNVLETEFKQWYEYHTSVKMLDQAIRFRLGRGIWYKPDFVYLSSTMGLTVIEVKGEHAFRGGFENLKVAASLYPMFTWALYWKNEQGQWQYQVIKP